MTPIQNKMNQLVRRVLLLIALIIIVAFPCFSQPKTPPQNEAPGYWALSDRYCNSRFGFCISYPASVYKNHVNGMLKDMAGDSNDGAWFTNANGLDFAVSGRDNSQKDSVAETMKAARDGFDRVTSQSKGPNWFLLQGPKKGATDTIVYLKVYVGRGAINQLRMEIPIMLNPGYQRVVNRIMAAFKPGQVAIAH
ncbi:MAG TPA: hypothetical protein VE961_25720 [Pyrinomonadaceae bacterium]|nr:hypothetical protein [Pyrinomonadaceae bacterium]